MSQGLPVFVGVGTAFGRRRHSEERLDLRAGGADLGFVLPVVAREVAGADGAQAVAADPEPARDPTYPVNVFPVI